MQKFIFKNRINSCNNPGPDLMMNDDVGMGDLDLVINDLKLELAGRFMAWQPFKNFFPLTFCFLGRDNQIESLQEQIRGFKQGIKDLKTSLKHKEDGIAQLKSQLEYQCLGTRYIY